MFVGFFQFVYLPFCVIHVYDLFFIVKESTCVYAFVKIK